MVWWPDVTRGGLQFPGDGPTTKRSAAITINTALLVTKFMLMPPGAVVSATYDLSQRSPYTPTPFDSDGVTAARKHVWRWLQTTAMTLLRPLP